MAFEDPPLFDLVQVTDTTILFKFSASVKSSTLVNENFVLYLADATPSQAVPNAFKEIDLIRDYKSISRTLYLYWDVGLSADTDYIISVSNIVNAISGLAYDTYTVPFTTVGSLMPDDEERPSREPIDVEDYSIKDPPPLNVTYVPPSSGSATPSNAVVIATTPTIDDAYYLEAQDNDGKITVNFNDTVAAGFVNSQYFVLQKKSMTSGLSKWTTVNADVIADTGDDSIIHVYLPSNAEVPLYSHDIAADPDAVYWIPATKYKLTISKEVSTELANSALGVSNVTEYLGALDPLYIDPNEVLLYYPDGDIIEITEYVYWASKDLEYILGKTNIAEVTPLMHDFVLASVLCKLSRIYIFDGGMNGFTSASSFTLGDLSVNNKTGTTAASSGNGTAGVDTWCDLAAILRAQLSNTGAGMKAIVKGSNFPNPIADRDLKRYER